MFNSGFDGVSGLPRGIPAASLKLEIRGSCLSGDSVFRGEYPRPHCYDATPSCGHTKGVTAQRHDGAVQ